MLAIAGLHTAAVTGFVFAAIRLLVAAWPWLALRVSGKKLAALGGLVAVAAYLALSGAHPPARRAAITASVAFLAILLDRRAVSLHSLALAALIILALQPLAVVEPGFQMSFCATAALVALAELWPRRGSLIQAPWFLAWPQTVKDATLGLLAVSFVAGAATGPFAIQHFNRMASYGLFANLFADLLASVVLMPAIVVAGIGEALGVAPSWLTAPLAVAGWSGAAILTIAHTFAHAPGASRTFASAPPVALLVSFLAIVFACLWRGRLRWIAAPLALAVMVWPRDPAPAAWLAADGANAAVVVNGRAVVLKPSVRKFASDAWIVHRGLIAPFDPDAETALAFDCNRTRCLPHAGVAPAIGAWWTRRAPKPEALDGLCRASAILILKAQVSTPASCDGVLVLRPADFARGGSAEIFPAATGDGWRLDWSSDWRGVRPWTGEGG
jgi:competence protein ComEC